MWLPYPTRRPAWTTRASRARTRWGPEEDEQDGSPAEKGPPEDIENDPAYNPDDENLKGIKGG